MLFSGYQVVNRPQAVPKRHVRLVLLTAEPAIQPCTCGIRQS